MGERKWKKSQLVEGAEFLAKTGKTIEKARGSIGRIRRHAGGIKLDNNTKPAKFYWMLKWSMGDWFAHDDLAQRINTTCITTVKSHVKCQLPAGEVLEMKRMRGSDGVMRHYTRLVTEG